MKVVVLSGGVGGARFVQGVVDMIESSDVTVVGNVGDDLEVLGLHVSPDLDSILYALAGVNDEQRGWGRADETWRALETVRSLGGETWFQLGDLDLGLHLVRTQAMRAGEPLSEVTQRVARALGIKAHVLPATDDPLRTWVRTPAGEFPFQEWFVARGHRDDVDAVRFEGEAAARAAPGVLEAIAAAELLLIAPSNPYLSIGPILAVSEIREAFAARRVPAVAVSPLIGGRAVKGPADRMLARLAGGTSPAHVASRYHGLIDAFVVDEADADDLDGLGEVRPIVTRTLMSDPEARRRLAGGRARRGARVNVAVLGGTGAFGSALARRLVEADVGVTIGSRDPARAAATAQEVGAAHGATNADAVTGADLVVLSVGARAALDSAARLAGVIAETPVLSVCSELRITNRVAAPGDEPLSLAERIQQVLRAPVVAGLHSLAAASLAAGKAEGDALVCGDDETAKALALELAATLVTGRALDAGPLASARALEGMTAVIVNLNRRYGGHAGLQVVGQ